MNKKQYEQLVKENKRLKARIKLLESQLEPMRIAFNLPELPKPSTLSTGDRELLQIYRNYLKRFKTYVTREEQLRQRVLENYGTLVGGVPRYANKNRVYTPSIRFYTMEQLEMQGGVERVASYYKNLRYATNARQQRRRYHQNYLEAIKDSYSILYASGFKDEVTRFYNTVKRMSDIAVHEAYLSGALPDIDEFYEIISANNANIVMLQERLDKFNKVRRGVNE